MEIAGKCFPPLKKSKFTFSKFNLFNQLTNRDKYCLHLHYAKVRQFIALYNDATLPIYFHLLCLNFACQWKSENKSIMLVKLYERILPLLQFSLRNVHYQAQH